MPYVRCPGCGLATFSAARWSSVDHCARCGSALPPARRVSRFSRTYHPAPPIGAPPTAEEVAAEQAVREQLYGHPSRSEEARW
jgi:hypothetical protein